jgi:shikimate dehydrogenase
MRFGVVGYPISHSRSPAMHRAGYEHVGVDAVYELIETPSDGFGEVVEMLKDGTFDGVNVTMPHKHNAFVAADIVDNAIDRLGAINTLVVRNGAILGFNTDIDGVKHALSRLELPRDTPVHVLGSGGAAAAAIIATQGTREVSISGRNEQWTKDLKHQMGSDAAVFAWGTWPENVIVINATPLGMQGESLPDRLIEASAGLVDMPYGASVTPAVHEAETTGIPYADGLVMLAGQAAEAFRIFTGVEVSAQVMESATRQR